MKLPKFVKKNLKDVIKYIIYIVLVVTIITMLHPSTFGTILIMLGLSLVLYIYSKIKTKEFCLKDLIKFIISTFITLCIILYTIKWLGTYGVIGFIFIIILLVAYRLIKQKEQYMEGLKEIETMIFGKPLDKDKWESGELKKFKWR